MSRGTSPLRDFPLVVWLVSAVVVALIHRWVPESVWLLVHLIALGAMTHAVLVWSAHFTAALLKTRPDEAAARRATWRLALLGAGSLLVFVGVPTTLWWLTLVGAVVVAGVWCGTASSWSATCGAPCPGASGSRSATTSRRPPAYRWGSASGSRWPGGWTTAGTPTCSWRTP